MARKKAERAPNGVAFPLSGTARSSTTANKHVLAAALDAAGTASAQQLLDSLQANKNWRFG